MDNGADAGTLSPSVERLEVDATENAPAISEPKLGGQTLAASVAPGTESPRPATPQTAAPEVAAPPAPSVGSAPSPSLPVPFGASSDSDFSVARLKDMLADIGVPLGGPAQAMLKDLERQEGANSANDMLASYAPMLGRLPMLQPLMGMMMSGSGGRPPPLPPHITSMLASVGDTLQQKRKEEAEKKEAAEQEREAEKQVKMETEDASLPSVNSLSEAQIESIVRRVVREEMQSMEARLMAMMRTLLTSTQPARDGIDTSDLD